MEAQDWLDKIRRMSLEQRAEMIKGLMSYELESVMSHADDEGVIRAADVIFKDYMESDSGLFSDVIRDGFEDYSCL